MTDKELITNNGIDDIVADKRIMYASREAGIRSFAETYSFNIESVLFNQLTLEQQKLWRKEIENAIISGGEMGLELADDKRYDERESSEDLEEEIDRFLDEDENIPSYSKTARHFAEWGRNHFEDKSEMVSEETTIVNDWQYGKDQDHAVIPAIHKRIEGFNVGDKVKIIICKTEQQ